MFTRLIELERCPPGHGSFVEQDGRELAVFRLDANGGVTVIDNACPHASGNLSGGDVCGSVVTCPWHGWMFDLSTGACVQSDRVTLARYPNQIRDGIIYVDLTAPY